MAKEIKFEDKMKRLNEIAEKLQDENTEIDAAISLYEEGLKLTEELNKQLKGFEEKIKDLSGK